MASPFPEPPPRHVAQSENCVSPTRRRFGSVFCVFFMVQVFLFPLMLSGDSEEISLESVCFPFIVAISAGLAGAVVWRLVCRQSGPTPWWRAILAGVLGGILPSLCFYTYLCVVEPWGSYTGMLIPGAYMLAIMGAILGLVSGLICWAIERAR